MTENKKLDVLIIIGLIVIAVVLTIVTPSGPACMETGHGYNCTQADFDNFKENN